jgi:hypothetical protein
MDTEFDLTTHMLQAVGPLWLVAVLGMFISAICESAKPKAEEGEEKSGGIALVIAGLASLITPILLFAHGFWTLAWMDGIEVSPQMLLEVIIARKAIVVGLFAALAAVAILGSIVGWIIRAAAPALGKTLNLAAVPLALLTLALTVFVSYEAALGLFALVTSG